MQVWRNKTERICIAESSGKWCYHAAARAPSVEVKGCNENDAQFKCYVIHLRSSDAFAGVTHKVASMLDVVAVQCAASETNRCRHNLSSLPCKER